MILLSQNDVVNTLIFTAWILCASLKQYTLSVNDDRELGKSIAALETLIIQNIQYMITTRIFTSDYINFTFAIASHHDHLHRIDFAALKRQGERKSEQSSKRSKTAVNFRVGNSSLSNLTLFVLHIAIIYSNMICKIINRNVASPK